MAWLYRSGIPRQKTVTHPSTNRAQRRVTSFVRRTTLPLRQATNLCCVIGALCVIGHSPLDDLSRGLWIGLLCSKAADPRRYSSLLNNCIDCCRSHIADVLRDFYCVYGNRLHNYSQGAVTSHALGNPRSRYDLYVVGRATRRTA